MGMLLASLLVEPCPHANSMLLDRQKELAAVKVQKEDIDLVAFECELDRKAAEARLREHRGNVRATLVSFL